MLVDVKVDKAKHRNSLFMLRNISLRLGEGESVLVVGSSGCGKTTFLLSMTGVLNNLLEGEVEGYSRIGQINLLEPDGFREVTRLVGVVLQDPDKQIAMPTPYDEVSFVLENLGFSDVEEKTFKILRVFGLSDKAFTSIEKLSGGEKRRLTIASAIVHDPPVILFDEPTASIDPWGVREVRKYFREHVSKFGRASIVVEHKARYFLDLVDEIILLENGITKARKKISEVDERFLKFLEEHGVDVRSPVLSREPNNNAGDLLLETRGLDIGYNSNSVVRDIDFEVHEREVVVVIGANGSGKTTFLKTIAGALKPVSGEILFRKNKLRIFYVPQNPDYMFIHTRVKRELEDLRKRSGEAFIEKIFGEAPWLKQLLDMSPHRLSHGQRRWLALTIARGYNPDIVLLDEPTTGLDLKLYRCVVEWIRNIVREGRSVIISSHDPRVVADLADRLYLIDNKRMREISLEQGLRWLEEGFK